MKSRKTLAGYSVEPVLITNANDSGNFLLSTMKKFTEKFIAID